MLELDDTSFEASLKKGKFLLMFYTDWCPLCPIIINILRDLEQAEHGNFTFAKIDFDTAGEAAKYYGAVGVPLVYAVIDGKPLYGCAGLMRTEGYRMIIDELLYHFDESTLNHKIDRIKERIHEMHVEEEV